MRRYSDKYSELIDREEMQLLRYLRKQRHRAISKPLRIEIVIKRSGGLSWRKRNFDNNLK